MALLFRFFNAACKGNSLLEIKPGVVSHQELERLAESSNSGM